ncbi:hypothetical protein [Lentibacillus amyloliquefaciens]|uniref:Uncharacterized protein n=1 Tax=Lentibacillus amyloliquefaciens TaxID=1472767 RepID=A0A0U4DR98_9BACI|nr:hypothetical protein [Lentibacillus amyloliquefaciens]ALX47864.1 hypothetical protein AOX59_04145 [Lentibacillus amyloliquefaciens]
MKSELDQRLKQINWKKAEYFKWKFDIRYDQRREKKSEEELIHYTQVKTMNSFYDWEKTAEYKALLQLYMEIRSTHDFEEIYNLVAKRAKEKGEDKDVKLFLKLQDEIKGNRKIVNEIFNKQDDDEVEDDDLEI